MKVAASTSIILNELHNGCVIKMSNQRKQNPLKKFGTDSSQQSANVTIQILNLRNSLIFSLKWRL